MVATNQLINYRREIATLHCKEKSSTIRCEFSAHLKVKMHLTDKKIALNNSLNMMLLPEESEYGTVMIM